MRRKTPKRRKVNPSTWGNLASVAAQESNAKARIVQILNILRPESRAKVLQEILGDYNLHEEKG